MPGMFDGIEAEKTPASRRCAVARLADVLDDEDAAALQSVVMNINVPAPIIRARLAKAGHEISKDAIWRHRRRDCMCSREETT